MSCLDRCFNEASFWSKIAEMRAFLPIALLIVAVCGSAFAQTPDCPTLSITGPSSMVKPREIANFTVAVDTKGKHYELKYSWSVSAGTIVSGQGTTSIGVRVAEQGNLTATVEVGGLPEGCSGVISEASFGDPPPQAIKIGQFSDPMSRSAKAVLDQAVASANDNPTSQLYILIGHIGGKPTETARANQAAVLKYLSQNSVDPESVTVAGVYAEVELMQLWFVPSGATYPRCLECEELEKAASVQACPIISLTGPANVTEPGDVMVFEATITGDVPPNLEKRWAVSEGAIEAGQGTLSLKVRTPKGISYNITVTIEFVGLPGGCKSILSETAGFVLCGYPTRVDEYSSLAWSQEKKRLDSVVLAAKDQPTSKILVLKYFKTGSKANRDAVNKIKQYLLVKGISKDRIEVLLIDNLGITNTKIYMVPPDAPTPTP